jgi:hypothetical protein
MGVIMGVSLTLFKNIYDNETNRRVDLYDFNALERVLYQLAEVPRQSKKDAELMSPAIYKDGTTRSNDTVIGWAGWCAIDVDEYEFEGSLEDDLNQKFGDYRYVCYSTASSTIDHPKFRILFPLTNPVKNENIRKFFFALSELSGGIADKQTKDFSRMFYIPATYAGANNFIFSHPGKFIDPDDLMKKYPFVEKVGASFFERLPEAIQKQIIEHRKSKLENTDVNWTSYRDCPFFPKQLEAEYRTISNTGWYHKMYQIMVAIAGNAIKNEYPITSDEIAVMCKEFDQDTGNWYQKRPLIKEADRALEYVYRNV